MAQNLNEAENTGPPKISDEHDESKEVIKSSQTPAAPVEENNISVTGNKEIPLKAVETPHKLSNSNMEIHHQSNVHHSKKWQDYLFEFIMLFLAVTAGFFMENLREHYVENKRAGVMALALLNDFRSDSSNLNILMQRRVDKITMLNQFMDELEKPVMQQNDSLIFFSSNKSLGKRSYFESESGTYEQVKNSGSLRYYDLALQQLLIKYEKSRNSLRGVQEMESKFVMEQIIPFLYATNNSLYARAAEKNEDISRLPMFRKKDQGFRGDYHSYAVFIKERSETLLIRMNELISLARQLISLLKNKYELQAGS
jgi:hypothetical protein